MAGLVERGVDCRGILTTLTAMGADTTHLTKAVAAAKHAQGRWHRDPSRHGSPSGLVWRDYTREREELSSLWDERLFQMARVVHSSDDRRELMRILNAPGMPHPAGIDLLPYMDV